MQVAAAETILLDALGLGDWTPPEPLTYTGTAADVFAAGRWDSQFHRPAWNALREELSKRFELRELAELEPLLKGRTVPYEDDGEIPIIRSGDLSDIEGVEGFLRAGADQPIFYLERGDVLISSIGFGSIGKVQVFDKPGRFGTVSEVTIVRQSYFDPYFLTAFLRSAAGQLQIEQFITGATGQLHLYPRDVGRIFVPVVDDSVQREMRHLAGRAREARKTAEQCLSDAKRAVEIAIERSEAAALRFLDDRAG